MNNRPLFHVFVPILLILLFLAVFTASVSYTFVVGRPPKPTTTAVINSLPGSSATPTPAAAAQYFDQAHIMDGIILWGIIIGATIVVGVFYAGRMTK
jgi:hypothetical protein